MAPTLDDTATEQLLHDLVDATSKDNAESTVLTYKNGMSKLLAECTKREDGAELSFLTLVSPATIEAYFEKGRDCQRSHEAKDRT